jgi:hypothetical protein
MTGNANGRASVPVAVTAAVLFLLFAAAPQPASADLISQSLCDLRVLYLFDEPEEIDWPTLFYLNEEFGCRVDLLTVVSGGTFHQTVREVPDRSLYLTEYFLDTNDDSLIDSLLAIQFGQRRPDVVIFDAVEREAFLRKLAARIRDLPDDEASLFNIRKVYGILDGHRDIADSSSVVTVSAGEMQSRYFDRMQLEIPVLYPSMPVPDISAGHIMQYELLRSSVRYRQIDAGFFAGLDHLRMIPVIDMTLSDGALKESFLKRAGNFISLANLARRTVGAQRVENIIAAYKELTALARQSETNNPLGALADFGPYMARLVERAQKAVLSEIGVNWQGKIILRDSPHGPRLKFRASLAINGPKAVTLTRVRFLPHWDTIYVMLDSTSHTIQPHQSFIREFLVDIDRSRLEANQPDSLVFAADILYGSNALTVSSSIPTLETHNLSIEFVPDFCFVPPAARIEVDKVVSSMNWKVIISKPSLFAGVAHLNLQTPPGVFAGAYRQTWQLERGRISETVRIPFSISNLMELGIHPQTITLSVDDHLVATDTGIIRIAACAISDTISVGLLADTSGLLEDILRMSGATYWPLTDRALQTADLDSYDVIVIGSGALRRYPSFRSIRGRLEDYLRYGGSLVLFSQPDDWPHDVLPISFVPTSETVKADMITDRIPQAGVMKRPYVISRQDLFSGFSNPREVGTAVLAPAEKVFVTPTGAVLLSVSRLGEGQVIFCGLPLIEMISRLELEAIHLFANILNY